jgi:hypothetical protein
VKVPELDVLDDLFYRVAHGVPVGNVASSSVVAMATELVTNEQRRDPKHEVTSLGFGSGSVQRERNRTKLCFTLDPYDESEKTRSWMFTIVAVKGKPFVSEVIPLDDVECR